MGGALVVIKDEGEAVFGVWMGEGIRKERGGYYGSGESSVSFTLLTQTDEESTH